MHACITQYPTNVNRKPPNMKESMMKSKLTTLWRMTYLAAPVTIAVLAGYVELPKLRKDESIVIGVAMAIIVGWAIGMHYVLS